MAHPDLGLAVRGVETLLRQRHHVVEFTDDAACIFRIAVKQSGRDLTLSDGTCIREGDTIVHLHFWNEHLPRMASTGAGAAWGNVMARRIRLSLAALARHLDRDPRYDAVAALYGATPFASRLGPAQMRRTGQRFGFDVIEPEPQAELYRRIHAMLDGVMLWGMAYTFNPATLRNQGFPRHRHQLWMSRARLRQYHGVAEDAWTSLRLSGSASAASTSLRDSAAQA